ncbi:unnamed protein product [Arctogadus glacialis]
MTALHFLPGSKQLSVSRVRWCRGVLRHIKTRGFCTQLGHGRLLWSLLMETRSVEPDNPGLQPRVRGFLQRDGRSLLYSPPRAFTQCNRRVL